MKAIRFLLVCAMLVATSLAQPPAAKHATSSRYMPVLKYDPGRNPNADLQAAIQEAQRTGRNILMDVGGNWCVWCRAMDKFFEKNSDVAALRDKNFVWMKVNFSRENTNQKFLSQYPRIAGYPNIFVLDNTGTLLYNEDTSNLESKPAPSYSRKAFINFLKKWSPSQTRGIHLKP